MPDREAPVATVRKKTPASLALQEIPATGPGLQTRDVTGLRVPNLLSWGWEGSQRRQGPLPPLIKRHEPLGCFFRL
jgi:hypothetical protein